MQLPIDDVLDEIVESLRATPRLAVIAPPGAGKTTRVPTAVLDAGLVGDGALWLLEPRRVAARSVARRIAHERGVRLGQEIGYQVRFDKTHGDATRLLVMTEGIMTRRLQGDPLLEGVGGVVLDEFHERSIHTDLALAFLREVQEVRPDFKIIVMSATFAADEVAAYLDAPVVRSEGRTFPVEVEYLKDEPDDLGGEVASAVRRAVSEDDGDVLVFLPGAREIHDAERRLGELSSSVDIHTLYGAMPPEKQDAALESGPRQKVILSTNIAETSLTIEGVTTVVDSGRVKVPYASDSRGFDVLETRWVSLASAKQRAGRAGRVRPGRAIRLWPSALEFRMDEYDEPEVKRIDLTATLLEVIAWSGNDPDEFDWFERPTDASIARGVELLRRLGALEPGEWRLTDAGSRMLELPLHPRLGRILIEAERRGCGRLAAKMAAVISERDFVTSVDRSVAPHDSDALVRADMLSEVASGRTQRARSQGFSVHVGRARTVERVARQLEGYVDSKSSRGGTVEDALKSFLVGYPDRVCFARPGNETYSKSDGGAVVLGYESVVRDVETFVALEVFGEVRRDGASFGIARMASRVEEEWLEEVLPHAFERTVVVGFDAERERVTATQVRNFGGVELERHIVSVDDVGDGEEVSRILAEHAVADLERAFGLSKDARAWLERVRFLQRTDASLELPDFDGESGRELIGKLCWGKRSFADLRRVDFLGTLHGLLGHQTWSAIEREAPARIEVPSGSNVRLDYSGEIPVLAVRLQEVFGWTETPRVASGKVQVLMHLLAPNFRPVQVTQDLASFWASTYPEVRKEMRARYSKHPWPEDPLSARAIYK